MASVLSPPAVTIVEYDGDEVHVSKPDGMTYVIQNGMVVRTFSTTTAKVVPLVYLQMGSTYVVPPTPSAPPAEPEQLEALRLREERMERARAAMLKLVLHRRSMATAAKTIIV